MNDLIITRCGNDINDARNAIEGARGALMLSLGRNASNDAAWELAQKVARALRAAEAALIDAESYRLDYREEVES